MKRRNLLLGSAAILSAAPVAKFNIARAGSAPDPNRLKQDLTPFGAERAGNASGTIPAWTGGVTAPPASWSKGDVPPSLFADEQPLYTITQENMAQYADILTDGQNKMLTQYGSAGWKFKVYTTHRTSAAPQYVYDNMFKNVTRAQPVSEGYVNGFTGAFGGPPYPILSDDPDIAGTQAMWNHIARWNSNYYTGVSSNYVCGNGQTILTGQERYFAYLPTFSPDATAEQIDNGYFVHFFLYTVAPANQLGAKFETSFSYQPLKYPNTTYEYLVGEGRIREAPQAQYDIPVTNDADAANYDEVNVFDGALDRYTWKLVGKKEVLCAYNNHSLFVSKAEDVFGKFFVDPEQTRWEIHRCWVVEAHLAPGKRMTEPFRRFYLDEDTWTVANGDSYDEQGNLWKFNHNFLNCDATLPGVTILCNTIYNLQSQQYVNNWVFWSDYPGGIDYSPIPASKFSPQGMANNGGL